MNVVGAGSHWSFLDLQRSRPSLSSQLITLILTSQLGWRKSRLPSSLLIPASASLVESDPATLNLSRLVDRPYPRSSSKVFTVPALDSRRCRIFLDCLAAAATERSLAHLFLLCMLPCLQFYQFPRGSCPTPAFMSCPGYPVLGS